MPLPVPKSDEKQKEFISRCIDVVSDEFSDPKQRVAVCYNQWKKPVKKDSSEDIERSFVFNLDYSEKSSFNIDKETGFLHAKARLTRSGVFDYRTEDGDLLREYRSPEEVFNEKSVKSLQLKPITNDHPDEMVTIDNIKNFQIGTIGEDIKKDGMFLLSNIIITDKDVVQTISNRKKAGLSTELSCGYNCDIISDMGIHDEDGYYTHKQQNIRYNHISIVNSGRAGGNVRILDKSQKNNKQKEIEVPDKIQFTRKNINLNSLKMDAIAKVVDADSLDILNTVSAKLDEAVEIIAKVNKDKDELQGKFDQSSETIASLKEKIKDLSDINSPQIANMIKVRNDVEKIASELKVDCKDKDIKTIKCDCIICVSKNADMKDKSDEYINARFDSVVEIINDQKKTDGNDKFGSFMKNLDTNKNKKTEDSRQNFIDKDKENNRK